MSRISKDDRRLQLQQEAAGDHLYADRVRVYPKSVHGPVRRIKWAMLIVCLTIYYVLPWLRWHRGPGRPDPGGAARYLQRALLLLQSGALAAGHLAARPGC